MKKRLTFVLFGILASLFILSFVACSSPVTLYATWSDNMGNSIMMNSQKRYTAKIFSVDEGDFVETNGTFVYYMNTITFTDSNKNNTFAEWDIQGTTLYLLFTDSNGDKTSLVLSRSGDPIDVGEE